MCGSSATNKLSNLGFPKQCILFTYVRSPLYFYELTIQLVRFRLVWIGSHYSHKAWYVKIRDVAKDILHLHRNPPN